MGFWKSVKKLASYTPFTGFGAVGGGGFLGKGGAVDSLLGGGKEDAANALEEGTRAGVNAITNAYTNAPTQLTSGYNTAMNTAKTGFQKAADTAKTGYDAAQQQYQQGGQQALDTAKQGYAAAKGRYETPEMVTSRAELYNRVLGKGGLQPDVVNQMEGKAREEYGTSLRDVSRGLSQFAGDSTAGGKAGENYARAAARLGGQRANTIRDIETQNAQLARQEQTGAITSMQNEAYQRAGLDQNEAQFVSGLQEKIASGGAQLTAQEAQALSQLAEKEGTTVADLQAKLATGQAQLTTEEAKALAEIYSSNASNQATLATTKTGPFGLW